MGSPETGLLSLDADTALVTNLSNFTADEVKLLWKCCTDDMWRTLVSLAHDASLELLLTSATPALMPLQEVEMHGLTAAIWRLEAAVAAIFNTLTLAEENKYLRNILGLDPVPTH